MPSTRCSEITCTSASVPSTKASRIPEDNMATLEYVPIPPCATRLRSSDKNSLDPEPELKTNIPADHGSEPLPLLSSPTATTSPTSPDVRSAPTDSPFDHPTLQWDWPFPAPAPTNISKLMSKKDPLSIPITTVNFRRFVARVGAVFWLQDRVEEIVMWRKGWKYTATWVAAYIPALSFAASSYHRDWRPARELPFIALSFSKTTVTFLAIDATSAEAPRTEPTPPFTTPVAEGSKEWLANIQGIQNLMGFGHYTELMYMMPLSHSIASNTPSHIAITNFNKSASSYYLVLHICCGRADAAATGLRRNFPLHPLRLISLVSGIAPVLLLHPSVLPYVPLAARGLVDFIVWCVDAFEASSRTTLRCIRLSPFLRSMAPYLPDPSSDSPRIGHTIRHIRTSITRFIDNDRLQDDVWNAPITEVELFENERWKADEGSYAYSDDSLTGGTGEQRWSKANLRDTERRGWTRGRDGWNGGVGGDGFVRGADCETDLLDGWTYTNDVWSEPKAHPVYQPPPTATSPSKDAQRQSETPTTVTVTRRRRWTRRIWYKGV
ncbi:integral peroxisomal membrane peroxin-domain-containing protein [Salix suchowensis]|nr:integral peroxisomal membrane peroxin-domain-containing protein [Salix suchowensis]